MNKSFLQKLAYFDGDKYLLKAFADERIGTTEFEPINNPKERMNDDELSTFLHQYAVSLSDYPKLIDRIINMDAVSSPPNEYGTYSKYNSLLVVQDYLKNKK
jgi:hypothetical protein